MSESERQSLSRAGLGPTAAQELVRLHCREVLAMCLARTGDLHDAEDIMQDVFLTAFQKLRSLREPGKARAWLLQVARNKCVDGYRRRRPTCELPADVPAPKPSQDDRVGRLPELVASLPEDYREAITLHYLAGLDCKGIAQSLGLPLSTVRGRLFRGRLMLQKLLTEGEL